MGAARKQGVLIGAATSRLWLTGLVVLTCRGLPAVSDAAFSGGSRSFKRKGGLILVLLLSCNLCVDRSGSRYGHQVLSWIERSLPVGGTECVGD